MCIVHYIQDRRDIMIPMEIKRAQIEDILNKAPGDTVTAVEWNAIFDLLVTQTDYLSEEMVHLDSTMTDILTGKVPHIEVDMNVVEFDGHPSSYYAKANEVAEALDGKQAKVVVTPERVLTSSSSGAITTIGITAEELLQLNNIETDRPIQTQLDGKLSATGKAVDSARVNGKPITISQSQPTATEIGHVWISW